MMTCLYIRVIAVNFVWFKIHRVGNYLLTPFYANCQQNVHVLLIWNHLGLYHFREGCFLYIVIQRIIKIQNKQFIADLLPHEYTR